MLCACSSRCDERGVGGRDRGSDRTIRVRGAKVEKRLDLLRFHLACVRACVSAAPVCSAGRAGMVCDTKKMSTGARAEVGHVENVRRQSQVFTSEGTCCSKR